jgi:hypothetical protein
MHAKFQHVRMRRPEIPDGQNEDLIVQAMRREGGANAPQAAQPLNRMINGREPVNRGYLTLLSKVFDLPTIRAEDWYELSDLDFFDKVDGIICHDPVGVLIGLADASGDLDLEIARTSGAWSGRASSRPDLTSTPTTRSMELGSPRRRRRPISWVAPGDGLVLKALPRRGGYVEALNIDAPDSESPKVFLQTALTDLPSAPHPGGPLQIRRRDGSPIPIGDDYLGRSFSVVTVTVSRFEGRWRPRTDGLVSLAELRDFVIWLMRLPDDAREVFAAVYETQFPKP